MRYALFMTLICCFASDVYAQDRIRDMSMSPEDSMRVPDVSHSADTNAPPARNGQYNNNDPVQQRLSATNGNTPAKSFMASYCDPNLRPGTGAMQECIQQQRHLACQRFQRLPADVQDFIDRDMLCLHFAGEIGGGVERDKEVNGSMDEAGCSTTDASRFDLAKKYRREADVMDAVLFFAEDTAEADSKCIRSR